MNDEKLEDLLREAGRRLPAVSLPLDLAERVARSLRHRKLIRTSLRTGMVALVVLGSIGLAIDYCGVPRPPVEQASAVAVALPGVPAREADLQDEITRLRADVQQLRATIQEMSRRDEVRSRLSSLEQKVAQPDGLELARVEFEKTAFLLVEHASQSRDSRAEYRRVVQLFPETSWAKVAQDRLNQSIRKSGGL